MSGSPLRRAKRGVQLRPTRDPELRVDVANARPVAAHRTAIGVAEASHHLRRQGLPILVGADLADVPGGVTRAIVDPTVLFPWSIVYRRGSEVEPGVAALLEAARATSRAERWLDRAVDSWLPAPERSADLPNRQSPLPARTR